MRLFKKIHSKMISVFGKNYGGCFGAILNGILFAILSIDYKDSGMRKIQLLLSCINISLGICWLIYSYRETKRDEE